MLFQVFNNLVSLCLVEAVNRHVSKKWVSSYVNNISFHPILRSLTSKKVPCREAWLDCTTDSVDINLSKLWEIAKKPGTLQSVGSQSQACVSEQQQRPVGDKASSCLCPPPQGCRAEMGVPVGWGHLSPGASFFSL